MTETAKNFVAYATLKQAKRIGELRKELEFYSRIQQEIAKPIVDGFNKARLALAHAIDELGVPADGRVIHFKDETDEKGAEGIYFETIDRAFDRNTETWVPRSEEDKVKWAVMMQARGANVPVPLKGGGDAATAPPEGVDPATHDLVPEAPASQPG